MPSRSTNEAIVSLQSIDLVTQTLSALTEFIGEVGDQICVSQETDMALATHKLKLGDLRARLLNDDRQNRASDTAPELF